MTHGKIYNKSPRRIIAAQTDVSQFCKSCHTYQMVGKPIPAFDGPFSRISIDCVGPLPKTKSGHEYILTIVCASTCFSEAIPLRNIKTKNIVKAPVKFFFFFFTFIGLAKSDQGSNFMSGIFQHVMHDLDNINRHLSILKVKMP